MAFLTGRIGQRTPSKMPPSDNTPKPAPNMRETKLAQALRANLRRRKAGPAAKELPPASAKSVDES
jgi:hypothetical protein